MAKTNSAAVDRFFATNPNFRCPKLNARILRVFCFKRIISPKPDKGKHGVKRSDNPMDAYCRSGECVCGQETIKLLGMAEDYGRWLEGQPEIKNNGISKPSAASR